jgi:arylsulfatase A-like enzyme
MRQIIGFITLALVALNGLAAAQTTRPRYNVLFIMSDDLRAETSTFGGLAKTPNIDRLAKSSVQFDKAYCQFPLCNPSRSSLLTGRYPGETGVIGNGVTWRSKHPDWVSLPQLFKENGYASLRTGKIFHGGMDDPKAWTEGGDAPGTRNVEAQSLRPIYALQMPGAAPATAPSADDAALLSPEHRRRPNEAQMTQGQRSDRWLVLDGDGEGSAENNVAARAIAYLQKYKDEPFFIGCGFSKPHSPLEAPLKYYKLYDLDKIPLPPDYAVRPTVPEGFPAGSIRPRNADLFIGRDSDPQSAKEMIRAYLASTSWMDWNVGRVLDELDRLGLRDKTIVIFWGDHGYQLGEKGKWSKAGSLWEQGARVPLTMYVPGFDGNGKACTRVIEALDLYPTLMELCGLPKPPQELDGVSLVPLLKDPSAAHDRPAFTVWSQDGRTLTGVSVRTDKYRYAEFTSGGAMLLDEAADPHEMKNVVDDPRYADVKASHAALVKQYRAEHDVK